MREEITIVQGLFRKRSVTYVGSCTVWHERSTGRMARGATQDRLCAIHALRHRGRAGNVEIDLEVGIGPWKRTRRFFGNHTVWHDVETGRRAGIELEVRLSEEFTRRSLRDGSAD